MKEKLVPSAWLEKAGRRLDCGPCLSGAVKALQEALTGVEKVAVTGDGLRAALTQGGVPCTVEELKARFERYVASLTKGKDVKKVRVVVE